MMFYINPELLNEFAGGAAALNDFRHVSFQTRIPRIPLQKRA
jgi:hypothetical protein